MTASITFYNSFRKLLGDGTIDLDTDTFKVALLSSSYTFDATDTVLTDLTGELSTANGYTSGGATLSNVSWTQSTDTVTFDADDVVWTASGGSIAARFAVIYDDTASDSLVACVLLDTTPADVTATDGNTLTLTWNASGIFTLTTPS